MKVLFVNTYDELGGATKATRRILRAVHSTGVQAELLVQWKSGDNEHVIEIPNVSGGRYANKVIRRLDKLPKTLASSPSDEYWSTGALLDFTSRFINQYQPDILHLNWVGDGFLALKALQRFQMPVIWTLQDFWPITGGCHYPRACNRYQHACGNCPLLGSKQNNDISRIFLQAKSNIWKGTISHICTPSAWAAQMVRESTIFKDITASVIPNPIDTDQFYPIDKVQARAELQLDQSRKWIVFGAVYLNDSRKGFDLLFEALMALNEQSAQEIGILIFGEGELFREHIAQKFHTVLLGYIDSIELLRLAYSAADVAVFPSRYETWGQVVVEALACGTLVVAFNNSGPGEIVLHRQTGYLVQPFDPVELAEGIMWVLRLDGEVYQQMVEHSVKQIQGFALEPVGMAYKSIYHSLLADA